jgi:hypothetical protein
VGWRDRDWARLNDDERKALWGTAGRRDRCEVCGRPVRGLPDARKEGKLWFCSQGHFLSYTGDFGGSTSRRPLRTVRKVVKWTLLVCGVLFVAIVVAAIAGVGNESQGDSNRPAGERAAVRNSQADPLPLGKVGGVGGGWRLRVTSVVPNAVSFLGDERQRPQNAQEFRVSISATFAGAGHTAMRDLFARAYVIGTHHVAYSADGGDLNCAARMPGDPWRAARPLNQRSGADVFSGATVRGHLCFAVARNDAKTLVLFVHPPGCGLNTCTKRVWFALRR